MIENVEYTISFSDGTTFGGSIRTSTRLSLDEVADLIAVEHGSRANGLRKLVDGDTILVKGILFLVTRFALVRLENVEETAPISIKKSNSFLKKLTSYIT